jgi:hypothetical protein
VCEPPGHRVTHGPLATAAAAPLVGFEDPTGEHGPVGCETLAGHLESELIETAERGQISAREPMIGARRTVASGMSRASRWAV